MMDEPKYLPLTLPQGASRSERQGFKRLCTLLAEADLETPMNPADWIHAAHLGDLYQQPRLAAAAHTIVDLVDQGWTVRVDKYGPLLAPPQAEGDRVIEKARVRRQELISRDFQLAQPSVRRFIQSMERPHPHGESLVSIFDLMRDGRDLADTLAAQPQGPAIQPYVQIVDGTSVCDLTGFKLHDIWRYFRHTWSNAYSTVPGRSMPILIRDAATEHHAIIGIAAISSPVVQIAERDAWIGWDTRTFIRSIEEHPTLDIARWMARRIAGQKQEIYAADFLRDGVLQPRDVDAPTPDAIARLRADGERHRAKHHRASAIREVRSIERDSWVDRAETYLFRSKRAFALAEALEIESHLGKFLQPRPTVGGLRNALSDPKARLQIGRLVRRARGERVGTVIADLTVCGAIAPYNALAAGKLVGALAVSAPVLEAYREKYSRPSEIASAMAGRPITREARLAFIGTTSLYGTGSSQYNRLSWPAEVSGGEPGIRLGFYELGRSRSFGTSHFSPETIDALVRVSEHTGSLVRVNSLFGEGVSPRLRKVRLGLAALGWPANDLLKHGRERILYGVPLVKNIRDYSLGVDREPHYLLDPIPLDRGESVAAWWMERWGRPRAARADVQDAIRTHTLVRPILHGARVASASDDGLDQSTSDISHVAVGN